MGDAEAKKNLHPAQVQCSLLIRELFGYINNNSRAYNIAARSCHHGDAIRTDREGSG